MNGSSAAADEVPGFTVPGASALKVTAVVVAAPLVVARGVSGLGLPGLRVHHRAAAPATGGRADEADEPEERGPADHPAEETVP
jgi:hypothetical protein